ncbi:unnamed protein product [Ophioblennius macclurei]
MAKNFSSLEIPVGHLSQAVSDGGKARLVDVHVAHPAHVTL